MSELTLNRLCGTILRYGAHINDVLDAIKRCSSVRNLYIEDKIGEGSYGLIYSAHGGVKDHNGTYKVQNMVIKIDKIVTSYNKFNKMTLTTEYSYMMGMQNIGPVIYDAFYIPVQNYNAEYNGYRQIVIMQQFSHNGAEAICEYPQYASYILHSMIYLLRQTIFYNKIYCIDIKPINFVVDFTDMYTNYIGEDGEDEFFIDENETRDPLVRMIDFGEDHCKPENLPAKSETDLYYVLLILLYNNTISRCRYSDDGKDLKEIIDDVFCQYMSPNSLELYNEYYTTYYYEDLARTLDNYVKSDPELPNCVHAAHEAHSAYGAYDPEMSYSPTREVYDPEISLGLQGLQDLSRMSGAPIELFSPVGPVGPIGPVKRSASSLRRTSRTKHGKYIGN